MGSPKSEAGRHEDEILHGVTLTEGFWLFDTPVTQALWTAVMKKNPSRFQSPQRPVEKVSWDDCQEFIEKINRQIPGLALRLPTEAEWEYACRAGTTSATYAGDLEIKGENNAPMLDAISWYGGNSGVEFELKDGWDTSDWKEMQYPRKKAGTHPVAQKAPNAWGLYDMLGNVWEWCSDWYGAYSGKDEIDPTGPEQGADRVGRGGGWDSSARFVRAAYRGDWHPDSRDDYLGFRCARGQGEPGRSSEVGGRAARPGPAERPGLPARRRAAEELTPIDAGGHAAGRLSAFEAAPMQAQRGLVESSSGIAFPLRQEKSWRLQTDTGILTMRTLSRPTWAEGIGRDRFGLWLTFRLGEVEQRLRYIPPGRFMMGSPKNEAGRFDNETPHRVTLTQGFWLFDTPVTQALWTAVMKKNPSRFQSPQRPVEKVSWEECQTFIEKINRQIPGLDLRLPTEAEWEYACRAGATTATYAGDLEIKGERNAPILDGIAWYGGNSGVEFELKDGWDTSDWKEMQYPRKKAGTHPVAQKAPNAWGLYDMLGNVWEWCSDWYGAYSGKDEIGPTGPEQGANRVLRGGCWDTRARIVRAAYRGSWHPDGRDGFLGFRCARGQDQAG